MDVKNSARRWLEINLPKAMQVGNDYYTIILLLSTIDCFAQAWGGFPKRNVTDNFCNFVLQHTSNSEPLSRVCPVTLYYDYQLRDLPLHQGDLIPYDDAELNDLSNKLILGLPESERECASKKHRYVRLLYTLRSKLVHELSNPGTPIEFVDDKPTISSGIMDGKRVWTLNFPKLFIYELAQETIGNYLGECDSLPIRGLNLSWQG